MTSNRIWRRRSLANQILTEPIEEIHLTAEMDFFTYRSDTHILNTVRKGSNKKFPYGAVLILGQFFLFL